MSTLKQRTFNPLNVVKLTYRQRLALLRRATLGLSLISAFTFSGCEEMSMSDEESFASSELSSHSSREGAPNYSDDYYGEAAGEMAIESEAIIDGVEVTYNQEEDASQDNQGDTKLPLFELPSPSLELGRRHAHLDERDSAQSLSAHPADLAWAQRLGFASAHEL